MRLQFASDLHLETTLGQPFSGILTPTGHILILAGDICPVENPIYNGFLRWCSQNWKQVLVVAGNHEYFCEFTARTIPEVDACIQNIVTQLPNVLFLQGGDSIVIGGFRFVGTTLWSKVDTSLWADARLLQKGDYTHTGYPPGRLTQPADIVSLHHLQKKYLEAVILTSKEPVIVITHHLPTYHLVADAHAQNPLISTYATNLEYLMIPNVRVWICGHSHTSKQWVAPSETVCILNPRGYGGSNLQFYKSALIDLGS